MEQIRMIKRILVGLAGTPYTRVAVRRAIEIARKHGAYVTGVTVLDVARLGDVGPVPLGGADFARQLGEHRVEVAREHIDRSVDEFVDACTTADVAHGVVREQSDPFSALISAARYHDLMVFGLRSLFKHDVVPDPHESLVRLVVAGVRPILAITPHDAPVRRVLIAYSGSMESAKTMKRFVVSRLWDDVTVRIVTFDRRAHEARQLLADACDYCRAHGLEPETDLAPGPPLTGLLPYAHEWRADAIVAGNSAKNLMLRRVFGETALNLIRESDLPLFLSQ
jgi:nucleotide-binding universal stress UspA family protein